MFYAVDNILGGVAGVPGVPNEGVYLNGSPIPGSGNFGII